MRLNDCWDTPEVRDAPVMGDGSLSDDEVYCTKADIPTRLKHRAAVFERTKEEERIYNTLPLDFPAEFGFKVEKQTQAWTEEEEEMLKELQKEQQSSAGEKQMAAGPAFGYQPITEHYVFEPTPEVYGDFGNFIEEVQKRGGHRYGVIKIRVPKEWHVVPQVSSFDISLTLFSPAFHLVLKARLSRGPSDIWKKIVPIRRLNQAGPVRYLHLLPTLPRHLPHPLHPSHRRLPQLQLPCRDQNQN